MREHWGEAINEIDEKYINETVRTLASNAKKEQGQEEFEQEASRPLELKPSTEPKKSCKGRIIGLSAAAAVVVVAIGIGGIMLSKGNNVLLPTDTQTSEVDSNDIDIQPLNVSDYKYIEYVSGEDVMVLTDSMTSMLEEIMSGVRGTEAVYDVFGFEDGVFNSYLHLYEDDSVDSDVFFRIHKANGKYYYSLQQGAYSEKAYFEISEEIYSELFGWFISFLPQSFIGVILDEDGMNKSTPETGDYIIRDNDGGVYWIHSDKHFEIADTVKVYYYGLVMDIYPARINTYNIEKITTDDDYIRFIDADDDFDGMCIAVNTFFGKWGSEDDVLEIGMYESPFTCADPMVGCSEDENGFYMLGESRAWYIPKSDPDMLYYFDNITDGQQIDIESCTASYKCMVRAVNDGVYGGNGEMGYLGLLNLCYSIDSGESFFDMSDFFDMELTDENGTLWVRTEDRSVDWGGVYEININGVPAHCLKMQNAGESSEMKYFSFFFSVSDGKLTWTDEHYCFDLSVCNIKELPTEFAESSERDVTQDGVGCGNFVVDPYFYPCADGSYYAARVMGNNQSQWLSDSEIFYNDGNGYALVSDKLGSVKISVIGDRLYAVYNGNDGLMLNVYDKADLIDIMTVSSGGENVNMGTSVFTRGKNLIIEYYDNGMQREVFAVADASKDKLTIERGSQLIESADGTVRLTDGIVAL